MQIAISAGHEFTITTDAKYSEICDDKIMYLDYVSVPSSGRNDGMLTPFPTLCCCDLVFVLFGDMALG